MFVDENSIRYLLNVYDEHNLLFPYFLYNGKNWHCDHTFCFKIRLLSLELSNNMLIECHCIIGFIFFLLWYIPHGWKDTRRVLSLTIDAENIPLVLLLEGNVLNVKAHLCPERFNSLIISISIKTVAVPPSNCPNIVMDR